MRSEDDDPSLLFPEDLLIKLFSWLPVKPLLRFKCLSKRWLDIISSDPHFIHLHSHQSKSKPPHLFFSSTLPSEVEINKTILLQSSTDMEGNLLSQFEISKRDATRRPLMLPTRFDLVCLVCNTEIHVCNPSTHELITLPPLLFAECNSFGFGYVESTDEYKIVHLIAPFFDGDLEVYDPILPTQCSIFTLGMAEDSPSSYASPWAWKTIGNSPYNVEHCQCPAFVDGALHWLINRKRHPELLIDIEKTILAFNLENEEFRLVPRPSGCSDLVCSNLQLVELKGLLCLSCVDEGVHIMDIWMPKDYCNETRMFTWVKEYNIDLSTLADTPYGSYSRFLGLLFLGTYMMALI
ncbi:F-box protein At3g07870-like [Telopea speciosissima]|uniref:F-box protein At3g07870-like n=1 Tax=Telopea speciosissima TaxID=54955 RepID=UPI001CC696D1|nr:F-box protein At3g07870-like [Telopea speciosissima]